MKKLILVFVLIISGFLNAQDTGRSDLRPYRIGLKIGTPNVAGISLEYVTLYGIVESLLL